MNVINIRGTTGSGKTTLVQRLIKSGDFSPPITISQGVIGHYSDKICIIGPYTSKKFGGVDAIKKISYVEPAIYRALEKRPIIIFEGLLISHSYGRWERFSKVLRRLQKRMHVPATGMKMLFIMPSFRVNIQRLRFRNNTPPFKTLLEDKGEQFIKNFVDRYKSIKRISKKAEAEMALGGLIYKELDCNDPLPGLQEMIELCYNDSKALLTFKTYRSVRRLRDEDETDYV